MKMIRTASWYRTDTGEPRGYIDTSGLREVWFHTGTACNLACPFCLEGSKPGDDRLQLMKLEDVVPFIDEAVALGAEQFSFTGGEPFVARDMHKILSYAAERGHCLILTNGTDPLLQRMDQLADLPRSRVSFRISIDFPDKTRHEAGRGHNTFETSLDAICILSALGFPVSLARQSEKYENAEEVESRFRALFRQSGIPEKTPIISFPDFLLPGSNPDTPEITEHCMTSHYGEKGREGFMCSFSRMVVKQKGKMRVYACTLVDDDARYDLGETLSGSLSERIYLGHHRCYSCFQLGASCSQISRGEDS